MRVHAEVLSFPNERLSRKGYLREVKHHPLQPAYTNALDQAFHTKTPGMLQIKANRGFSISH
ncbi:hypothetical protein CEF21_21400 [Bacillus sp. FJAT-42376]|nr:hypothetical protein CEF21_21400 [Bacillus sp. FJAT-42376]